MIKPIFFLVATCLLMLPSSAFSQTDDPPRFEVAAEFTALTHNESGATRFDPGFGARFTFNFNKNFAIDSSAYFFPCNGCANNGQIAQAVAGLKAGKRFQSWGIFAKVRPGVVTIGGGQFNVVPTGAGGPFPFEFQTKGLDHFATDLGGVVEFYPSRRIVTRFDLGDTILHSTRRTNNGLSFDPATMTFHIQPFTTPARTTHNFQITASVGFRF